jgi:hypothetical protein
MMQIFTTRQKSTTPSKSIDNNDNTNNLSQTNQVKDYQILIGDNGFTPCTSQQNLCQRELNENSYEDNRNYISSPNVCYLVLFLVIYVLLILLGASIFSLFEQKAEFQIRDQLLRKQQTFLAKHPCVDVDSLDSFIDSVIDALEDGVNLSQLNQMLKDTKLNIRRSNTISPNYVTDNRLKRQIDDDDDDDHKHKNKPKYNSLVKTEAKESNNYETSETKSLKNILNLKNNTEDSGIIAFSAPTDGSNWEFTSSLLFVTSIVTTIGYGHITPITLGGKLFCIIFSCVAIPFTLLFLSIIVSLLQNGPIKIFEKWLIKIIPKYFRVSLFAIRILHLLIITLVLLILILILPALIFSYFESEWTFLDSFYYCYISLTTVGLGDFVPGTSTANASQRLYRLCIIIYLYGGLSMIMLWIALILRIPQLNFKNFLVIEKMEIDERSRIIDYNKEIKHKNYGTEFSTQK